MYTENNYFKLLLKVAMQVIESWDIYSVFHTFRQRFVLVCETMT